MENPLTRARPRGHAPCESPTTVSTGRARETPRQARSARPRGRSLGAHAQPRPSGAPRARPRRLAPALQKDAATPHELGQDESSHGVAALHSNCQTGSGAATAFWLWLFRASRSPRGRRARHAACSPAALKRRLCPHAARRVPRLSAPLPSVATPDNPRGLSAAARFGPRAAPLEVAARGVVLGPSRGLHARQHVRRPRARLRSLGRPRRVVIKRRCLT
jgi:hypothetical protein